MRVLETTLVLLLLACSAFFSGSEAALTALSALKMKRLSVIRPHLRPYFSEWLSHPHRLLTSILVGNNVVNITLSSLLATMALSLREYMPPNVLNVGVWLLTTAVLLVFGEIVPKIIARTYRERVAGLLMPVLHRFTQLCGVLWGPLEWAMKKWTPHLEAVPANRLTTLSLEEMHFVIAESQAAGHMSGESGDMMKRVLSLPQKPLSAVMQPALSVESVPLELLEKPGAAEPFVDLLVETGRSRVPVTRSGMPLGYIRVMDLLREWRTGRVTSIEGLVRHVRRVQEAKPALELLGEFQRSGEHVAFVEDGQGAFLGLVTLEDLLEEIVGEILDEYDWEQKKQ